MERIIDRDGWPAWVEVAILLVLAAVFVALGLSIVLVAACFVTFAATLLMMQFKLRHLLAAQYVITFALIGLLQYYLGFEQTVWISYVLGMLTLFIYTIKQATSSRTNFERYPIFIILFCCFFIQVTVAILLDSPPLGQLVVGLKIY